MVAILAIMIPITLVTWLYEFLSGLSEKIHERRQFSMFKKAGRAMRWQEGC